MACYIRIPRKTPDLHQKTKLLRAIDRVIIAYNKGEMTIYDVVDNLYIMFRGIE